MKPNTTEKTITDGLEALCVLIQTGALLFDITPIGGANKGVRRAYIDAPGGTRYLDLALVDQLKDSGLVEFCDADEGAAKIYCVSVTGRRVAMLALNDADGEDLSDFAILAELESLEIQFRLILERNEALRVALALRSRLDLREGVVIATPGLAANEHRIEAIRLDRPDHFLLAGRVVARARPLFKRRVGAQLIDIPLDEIAERAAHITTKRGAKKR